MKKQPVLGFLQKLVAGIKPLLLLSVVLVLLAGCSESPAASNALAQISTYPALEKGLYDGDVTYARLARMGNFGIGTFDGMDGEMIALDGQFYQARADGSVRPADKSLETPFATVTFFKAAQHQQLAEPLASYDLLKTYLAKVAPPTNRPYAIKLAGRFSYLKIRSVPKQNEPYPPLSDVVAKQVTWERHGISGTLVGYWFPQYLATLNAPGYHLHFISDDRQVAGHMLDCSLDTATIDIDYLDQVNVEIPQTAMFRTADLNTR